MIVAIVGNAAEHGGAIVIAQRGKMKLATEIAVSSSAQVALLVRRRSRSSRGRRRRLSLAFRPIELVTMGGAAALVGLAAIDGRTKRWEGGVLIGLYVVVARALLRRRRPLAVSAETRAPASARCTAREQLFVMPNPWDVGSARLLASLRVRGARDDERGLRLVARPAGPDVTRDELVAHVERSPRRRPLPLNVDSERCFPDEPGGVAETVAAARRRPARPAARSRTGPGRRTDRRVEIAAERVAAAAAAAHGCRADRAHGRAENHLHGVDDLDDTIARLVAYRDAGADVVYAPGLRDLEQIAAVVVAVGVPVNVLALPHGPTVAELASAGVRRVSTGGALARAALRRAARGARELLDEGTSRYSGDAVPTAELAAALRR